MLSCVQLSCATAANILIVFGVAVADAIAVAVAYACIAAFGCLMRSAGLQLRRP